MLHPSSCRGEGDAAVNEVLIRGGRIIDGTGRPAFEADLLVRDGRIALIGKGLPDTGARLVDARGKVVTPGFIDIHRHCDVMPFLDEDFGTCELMQGLTTVISGNCGLSPVPVDEANLKALYDYLSPIIGTVPYDLAFSSFEDYARALASRPLPLDMGFLAACGTIKVACQGYREGPYGNEALERAASLVEEAMQAGAFGASLGIMYLPECWSSAQELAQVIAPVARHDGLVSVHMRGEGDSLLSSVDEVIDIARCSGARLNISHFKATGIRNWGHLISRAIDRIEEARSQGLQVTADFYPYDGGSTTLQSLIPPACMEGGPEACLARLSTAKGREDFARLVSRPDPHWDNMALSIGWDRCIVSSVDCLEDRKLLGRDLLSASREECYEDAALFAADLYVRNRGRVGIIVLSMSMDDVETVARLPWSVLISDALYAGGNPHPRLLGAFPHFLRTFVLERHVLSYEEAVGKMTSLPAARLGLDDRGTLEVGRRADLLVFDPASFTDRADYAGCHDLACGLDEMLIEGRPVIHDARLVDRGAASFLRRKGN